MEVNELLSRNRDELMIFEEMDADRNTTDHRDALMTDSELPEWITQSSTQQDDTRMEVHLLFYIWWSHME